MSDHRCAIPQVWDDLALIFPADELAPFRELCGKPEEGFDIVRRTFAADVAGLTPDNNNINDDRAKRRLILGHTLLAVFDALRRGRTEFVPVPRVTGQPWPMQETSLLLWAAQHGTSDDRRATESAPRQR